VWLTVSVLSCGRIRKPKSQQVATREPVVRHRGQKKDTEASQEARPSASTALRAALFDAGQPRSSGVARLEGAPIRIEWRPVGWLPGVEPHDKGNAVAKPVGYLVIEVARALRAPYKEIPRPRTGYIEGFATTVDDVVGVVERWSSVVAPGYGSFPVVLCAETKATTNDKRSPRTHLKLLMWRR